MGARGLSTYAYLLFKPDAPAHEQVSTPLLLWETAPAKDVETLLLSTHSGAQTERPNGIEPLVFELKKGSLRGNAFAFGVTVGRTDANDVCVGDNSVSRFHAYFQQDAKTRAWKLVDAESKNGTFIEGERLTANKPYEVKSGLLLRFGEVSMRLLYPAEFMAFLDRRANGNGR